MCQENADILMLLRAPSVIMLLVAVVIMIIVTFLTLFRSSPPAKSEDEMNDMGIQFENSPLDSKIDFEVKDKRKSEVDPTHIARVARRSNRDGRKSPLSL
jgi:hypothetical protein